MLPTGVAALVRVCLRHQVTRLQVAHCARDQHTGQVRLWTLLLGSKYSTDPHHDQEPVTAEVNSRAIVEVRCHPARRPFFSRILRHAVLVELAMLTCLFGPCQLGARATSTHLKLRPHGASSQSHLTTSFSTSAHLRLTGGACTVLSMFDHDRSGYFHTCTFRVAWYYKLVGEEHHDGTW